MLLFLSAHFIVLAIVSVAATASGLSLGVEPTCNDPAMSSSELGCNRESQLMPCP
ncbi:hypothetical protein BFJ70_g12643 [Fusarium oxysporum]|nr:hypothetical protein BFJ70_g12643 [Fusarium oxysporum]